MPRLISAEEATRKIEEERKGAPCLPCALLQGEAGPTYILERTPYSTMLLCRYARQWGHLLILLQEHVTSYTALRAEPWQEASLQALRGAKLLERVLRPLRCYIASLGAADPGLPLTYPHLHLHVIPVYQPDDTPSGILTTRHGVYVAEEAEWRALHRELLRARE